MRPGITTLILVAVLGFLPAYAHAQYIPPWMFAAALSPLVVLILCIVLGLLCGSARIGLLNAALLVVWVLLFGLASYFVENDYVIWTPMVLYLLHSVLLLVLIGVQIVRRVTGSGGPG